jgi:hypothetical protein
MHCCALSDQICKSGLSGQRIFAMILKLGKASLHATKIRRRPFLIFPREEEKDQLSCIINGSFYREPLQLLCRFNPQAG